MNVLQYYVYYSGDAFFFGPWFIYPPRSSTPQPGSSTREKSSWIPPRTPTPWWGSLASAVYYTSKTIVLVSTVKLSLSCYSWVCPNNIHNQYELLTLIAIFLLVAKKHVLVLYIKFDCYLSTCRFKKIAVHWGL